MLSITIVPTKNTHHQRPVYAPVNSLLNFGFGRFSGLSRRAVLYICFHPEITYNDHRPPDDTV